MCRAIYRTRLISTLSGTGSFQQHDSDHIIANIIMFASSFVESIMTSSFSFLLHLWWCVSKL